MTCGLNNFRPTFGFVLWHCTLQGAVPQKAKIMFKHFAILKGVLVYVEFIWWIIPRYGY